VDGYGVEAYSQADRPLVFRLSPPKIFLISSPFRISLEESQSWGYLVESLLDQRGSAIQLKIEVLFSLQDEAANLDVFLCCPPGTEPYPTANECGEQPSNQG
jgi:hypothetical protein